MDKRKVALGLFHFNPHWNADSRSAHRHCTESLGPLLHAVQDNPRWCVSVELSGSGLEFLHSAYPGIFRRLKSLVESGQVELISSLYTPSLWVAFPRIDLINSVRRNIDCLSRLGLPWSRIFFAQEAFFGPGVASLTDYFDVAICKDDYVDHFCRDFDFHNPACLHAGMKVVVASNHLLNELPTFLATPHGKPSNRRLCASHWNFLDGMSSLNKPGKFPAAKGESGGLSWLWYHCGDGNHFGSNHKPDDLAHCYYDPSWSGLCIDYINDLLASGYVLTGVSDFVSLLDYNNAIELPLLPEGSWNAAASCGVHRWMGELSTPAENDNLVLTSVVRARERLLLAGEMLQGNASAKGRYQDLWKVLLHAQISDCLGWEAGPGAPAYALSAADQVFVGATSILDDLPRSLHADERPWEEAPTGRPAHADLPTAEIFGATAALCRYTQLGPSTWALDCVFQSEAPDFGVQFPLSSLQLRYCPTGLEHAPASMDLSRLKPNLIALPLANGLIELEPGLFLVKDTKTVHVAALLDRESQTLRFTISQSRSVQICRWRFFVRKAQIEEALSFANQLNRAHCDAALLLPLPDLPGQVPLEDEKYPDVSRHRVGRYTSCAT